MARALEKSPDERFRIMDKFDDYAQVICLPSPPVEVMGAPPVRTPASARSDALRVAAVDVRRTPTVLVLGPDGNRLRTRSGDNVQLSDLLQEAVLEDRDAVARPPHVADTSTASRKAGATTFSSW